MKRILVTRASRGIARAIAEKLAAPETICLLHAATPPRSRKQIDVSTNAAGALKF